tara:strand:+ start:2740 stop:3099 length:360 start_codon:yes stop_codon:yes gene_type:complete
MSEVGGGEVEAMCAAMCAASCPSGMSSEECRTALLGILIHEVFVRANHLPSSHFHSMRAAALYVEKHTADKVESTLSKLFAAYLHQKQVEFPLPGLTKAERHTLCAYALLDTFVRVTAP